MITKKEILNNLREYNSDQIVDAINKGVVTLYELSKSGNLTPLLRRRIEQKLSTPITEEQQTDSIDNTNSDIEGSQNDPSQLNDVQHSVIDCHDQEEANMSDNIVPENQPETQTVQEYDETIIPEFPPEFIVPATSTNHTSNNSEQDNVSTDNYRISNKGMFKKPFSFHGRIRRTEYGISYIIFFMWNTVIPAYFDYDLTYSYGYPNGLLVFYLMTFIPMYWFIIAQSCKRCHDLNNSGWYQLIPLYFLWLLFEDSEKGYNKYGDRPKD